MKRRTMMTAGIAGAGVFGIMIASATAALGPLLGLVELALS